MENSTDFIFFICETLPKIGVTLEMSMKSTTNVPVETDYVASVWDGLKELKDVAGSIREIVTSSCIPSVSSTSMSGCKTINSIFDPIFTKLVKD